ncbi:MAG: NADH-quinone oxidoreductase subunit C [Planctomycetes bacterium]|nr:NADH-quinone oxidoreductase subunit C [Planctomycetota bacterium]
MKALAFDAIATAVQARFPAVLVQKADNGQMALRVPKASIVDVAHFLRTDAQLAFDGLSDLTAFDTLKYPSTPPQDDICVVYVLFSYTHRHKVLLKVHAERAACDVPTVSGEWPAALYFEREVWDLFGVRFVGHPSLRRIMTPDDWEGHPLRKDYLYPATYNGVAHLRDGQHFEAAPPRSGGPL